MKKQFVMKINVLGTDYKVYLDTREHNKRLETADGYTNIYTKEIVIDKELKFGRHVDHVIKHELVHAFFFESGLGDSCQFGAGNETVVDWIALQLFKIANASLDVGRTVNKYYKAEDKKNDK